MAKTKGEGREKGREGEKGWRAGEGGGGRGRAKVSSSAVWTACYSSKQNDMFSCRLELFSVHPVPLGHIAPCFLAWSSNAFDSVEQRVPTQRVRSLEFLSPQDLSLSRPHFNASLRRLCPLLFLHPQLRPCGSLLVVGHGCELW